MAIHASLSIQLIAEILGADLVLFPSVPKTERGGIKKIERAAELGHLIQENDPAAGKGNLAFGEAIFSLRSVEAKFTGGIRVVVLSEIREIAGGHSFLISELAKKK